MHESPYRIEFVTLSQESEGPDYHTVSEYQVIKKSSGEVVKRFFSIKDDGIGYSYVSGARNVELSVDGRTLLVTNEDDEVEEVSLD